MKEGILTEIEESKLDLIGEVGKPDIEGIGNIKSHDLGALIFFLYFLPGKAVIPYSQLKSIILFTVIFKAEGETIVIVCGSPHQNRVELKPIVILQRIGNGGNGKYGRLLAQDKKSEGKKGVGALIH